MYYSLYDYVWFFMIYAVVGWMVEVAYAAVETGKLSNRGFLNGPLCPIYGFGMVIVIFALRPFNKNIPILFAGSFMLTSVLEFITGAVLEKLFNTKWWDYSDKPFNIMGYVCLKFSIGWGIGGVFIMRIIQPGVAKFVSKIPNTPGKIICAIYMISFVCDAAITVRDMVKFGMKLKSMEMLTTQLRSISDSMAQGIFEGVVTTQKSMDEFKDGVAEYTKEGIEKTKEGIEKTKELQKKYEELYTKYMELFSNKRFTNHRFTKAFPSMKRKIGKTKDKYNAFWDKYNEIWDKYKNMFS
ncbi:MULTISPECIES: putative ABC transporter permease [Eubacterium]|uniref:Uncharacterized membrane protein n=1 Tax=Eubacterium uniforme TaxID=39495 RepID=A0A1T4VCC2_9FIRM|nr:MULTISPECIES: putative ABC transporter permease [Eubacterium]MCR5628399.1 putative ABC transporter permease [Eubacterium sp.]SKA62553.1 Uncharacterized membrane protein [Eubacterium uniforme]HAH17539.1 hypothetical protein [Eubacterium sp.]